MFILSCKFGSERICYRKFRFVMPLFQIASRKEIKEYYESIQVKWVHADLFREKQILHTN